MAFLSPSGPTVCETVYESECATSYHAHEVEEDVPDCRTMYVEKCRDVTQGYQTEEVCDKWPKKVRVMMLNGFRGSLMLRFSTSRFAIFLHIIFC